MHLDRETDRRTQITTFTLTLEDSMSQDHQLQQAVVAELNWEPSLNAAHIGVTANAGVVALNGQVEQYAEKHAAIVAAYRVRGVKAVANEIEVRLPVNTNRSDDEIAAAAIERLAWDVSVPDDSVKVEVESGWITLTGVLEKSYQKDFAEQDLRRLHGVIGISNQITLKPRVDVSIISANIVRALHRSWLLDPKTISVSAQRGKVRLTGAVYSHHDRRLAVETAWAAPGVTDVEDEITIKLFESAGNLT
jgi:osmotically-inducible protein OsmY